MLKIQNSTVFLYINNEDLHMKIEKKIILFTIVPPNLHELGINVK